MTDGKLRAVGDYRVHARNAAAMWEALSKGHGVLLVGTHGVRIVAPSPYHALRAIVVDPDTDRAATVQALVDMVVAQSGVARRVVEDPSGTLDLSIHGLEPVYRMAVMGREPHPLVREPERPTAQRETPVVGAPIDRPTRSDGGTTGVGPGGAAGGVRNGAAGGMCGDTVGGLKDGAARGWSSDAAGGSRHGAAGGVSGDAAGGVRDGAGHGLSGRAVGGMSDGAGHGLSGRAVGGMSDGAVRGVREGSAYGLGGGPAHGFGNGSASGLTSAAASGGWKYGGAQTGGGEDGANIGIVRAAGPAELAAAERIFLSVFSPASVDRYKGRIHPVRVLGIEGWRVWLAYRGAVPAAAAYTFHDGTSVGVYQVATLPEHRGRGVARALVTEILRAYPHDVVTLTATEQGRPLYEALGFKTLSNAIWWRPSHTGDDIERGLR